MIIGSSGAGKSVFSQQLHAMTKLPLHHLDRLFWGPKWQESDKEKFRKRVADLAKGDRWIIDGNYGSTIEVRAKEADTIIFFDYPRYLCLHRALKRFLRGWVQGYQRSDMTEECPERITWQFICWVWTYPYKGRKIALEKIREAGFPEEQIIFFRNEKQKEHFLREVL